MQTNYPYPPAPENLPPSVTATSPAFKSEVKKVLGSIISFFGVYILLLLLSVGLIEICFYLGYAIIVNMPRLITIVAGLGLMGVGIMVFVFLIKFIFSVSRYDRSGIIEIKEEDQPRLFGFIRQLTAETQTKFPKKIFLSSDVNACVFYDSSFWSMFLPVKKNLQIGLGLVNAVSLSEFKAVMAHEFGHFSQRSMKLGSFVYQVNKIIHNMLFENRGYAVFLQSWANIDGVFALFAGITAGIANGIQRILRGMYGFINKKYMGLSREMEFHADAVAASVSGSESLSSALRRIEMASSGFDIALGKCDEFLKQNKISNNIYPHHSSVMLRLAEQNKLPIRNGLPVISNEFLKSMNFSRVNFKDQWASHPSVDDRVTALENLAIKAENWDQAAWVLFDNDEALQQLLTKKIYERVENLEGAGLIDEKEFDNKLEKELTNSSLPQEYNGYYDGREVAIIAADLSIPPDEGTSFERLFSPENAIMHKKIVASNGDLELMKAIQDNRIDTESFDFDGEKFNKNDAATIIEQLEKELKEANESVEKSDINAIRYFIHLAGKKEKAAADTLLADYEKYFSLRRQAAAFLNTINTMLESMQPIYSGQTVPLEQIHTLISRLTEFHEPKFKNELEEWKKMGVFATQHEMQGRVNNFISSTHVYFHDDHFLEEELSGLHTMCTESWKMVTEFIFEKFKKILQDQLQFQHQ